MLEHVETGRNEAQGLKGRGSIKHKEIGGFPAFDAVSILDAQCFSGIGCDQVEHVVDLFKAAHMAEKEGKLGSCKHVTFSQRKPGVHDGIVTESHVDASCQQLFDASDASPLGIGIEATL